MKNKTTHTENEQLGESLFASYRYLLVKYLQPQLPRMLLLSFLILGSLGLQLVNPQIMRQFIDTIAQGNVAGERGNELIFIGILFLGIAVVQQALGVWGTYVSTNVSWLATNRLRLDLAAHCLRLDMSFHNNHTPGEMISRVGSDTAALSWFFSQFIVRMVSQSLLLIGILVLLFLEDWRIGVALTVFSAVALFIIWRLKNIAVPHWRAWSQASAAFYSFLEERLNGAEDIRASGAKAYVLNGFYELTRALMKITLKAGLINNIMINSTQVLFALGNAISLAIGAWLFLNGSITIGTVYIIFHYSTMLAGPIQNLAAEAQGLQTAGGSVERIVELLKIENRLTTAYSSRGDNQDKTLLAGPLAVAFQNVLFRYDPTAVAGNGSQLSKNGNGRTQPQANEQEQKSVIRNVSFQLQPGKTLGLLGRTGSGKTTLARLLFRLYDPDSGTISIGNEAGMIDITQLPLAALRRQIGLVTQNVEIFNATVFDNLTFFDDSIARARILEVLRDLDLWAWYETLPDGLDTKISSGGKELSAGQAQLLAFARVFLQDPGLVILDEASSRLDPATEALIEQMVQRLIQDRTAIIIAHRLSTIQKVDEIMIIDNGRIQEHGERQALADDPNSRFSQLLQTNLNHNPAPQSLSQLHVEVLS